MNRRKLLATLGASSGALALAGCFEEQSVECRPEDDDIELDEIDVSSTSTVSFKGAIAAFGDSILIDDTNGLALLKSSEDQYIKRDSLEIGGCLSGEGVVSPDDSWSHRIPVLVVTRLQSLGPAERSVDSRNDSPDADFEVTVNTAGDCESTVELRHAGGDPIRSERLLVAQRVIDSPATEEQKTWWYERADVDPVDVVEEGDSITVTQQANTLGTLTWVADWSTQLTGWQTDPC